MLILSYLVIQINCDYNLELSSPILYCLKTEEVIDLDASCSFLDNIMAKLTCNDVINDINLLKDIINDEYKAVYTLEEKKIFYFSNSKVYNTKCFNIFKLEIIKDIENCTLHIRVKFALNSSVIYGYLTKEEIIRSDSVLSPCIEEKILLNFASICNIVIRKKQVILIGDKNKENITKLNLHENLQTLNKSNLNFLQKINLNYEKVVRYNGLWEFLRDLFTFLMICFVIFLIIKLLRRTNKEFLKPFINNLIKNYFENISYKRNEHLDFELVELKKDVEKLQLFISQNEKKLPSAPPFESEVLNESQTKSPFVKKIYPSNINNCCINCKRSFKTNRGLKTHLRTCDSKKKKQNFKLL